MTRVAVCLPTFNEAENVGAMIDAVLAVFAEHHINGHILVIDDASPDGTAAIVDERGRDDPRVAVLRRARKEGLGRAYRDGFRRVLDDGAEIVVQMDCDFSHDPAVIPALLAALDVPPRPWLFGHSDGASIALLHAARHPVAGVIAVAPHLFVEDVSIASIEKARVAFESGDLRRGLAKHHEDPDSAFRGWNDAWLAPAFRDWNIEKDIETIACPVLAVQGEDDEYGTLEQIRAVARRVPQTELFVIPACGHSPQRDQPELLIRRAGEFIGERS